MILNFALFFNSKKRYQHKFIKRTKLHYFNNLYAKEKSTP